MAGEDVISRVKDAEVMAAAIISDAESEAERIRAAAVSDGTDMVKKSASETRRNYETAILFEVERVKQEKEELVKIGRKEIYAEEERAKARLSASISGIVRKVEEYFHAQAR
jgi:vacuolar-type H+-ATPase subunit H